MLRQWILAAVVAVGTGRATTAVAPPPPIAAAASAAAAGTHVWVDCALGEDSNFGTSVAPFKSLVKARNTIRAARAAAALQGLAAAMPATVNIVGGICRSYDQVDDQWQQQNASLTLDGRDSHTTWSATGSHSATAVLSGGLAVNSSQLQAVSGAQVAMFKPAFVRQIRKLSLQGVDDIGKLKGLSYSGADACIRTDFFEPAGVELISVADGGLDSPVKMVLARFPSLVEPPTPHNWADCFDPNNTVRAMTVNATATQVSHWVTQASAAASGGAPQIWSHGLWSQDWADSHRQVLSVRPTGAGASSARIVLEQHGDKTDRDCNLTAARPRQQGGHVYLYNVLF
eukprot:SAG25_NODE_3168_length_1187_cov_16.443934_2_plen_342_part_01